MNPFPIAALVPLAGLLMLGSGVQAQSGWSSKQSASRICLRDTLKVTYTLSAPAADIKLKYDETQQFRRVGGPFMSRSTNTSYRSGEKVVSTSLGLTLHLVPLQTGRLTLPGIGAQSPDGSTLHTAPAGVEVVSDCGKRVFNRDFEDDFSNPLLFSAVAPPIPQPGNARAGIACFCDTPGAPEPAARAASRLRIRRLDTLLQPRYPLRQGIYTHGAVPCLRYAATDTAGLGDLLSRFPGISLRMQPAASALAAMRGSREGQLIDDVISIELALAMPGEDSGRLRNVYLVFYFRTAADREIAIRMAKALGLRTPGRGDYPPYDAKDGYQLWIAKRMKAGKQALQAYSEDVTGRMLDAFGEQVRFSQLTAESTASAERH